MKERRFPSLLDRIKRAAVPVGCAHAVHHAIVGSLDLVSGGNFRQAGTQSSQELSYGYGTPLDIVYRDSGGPPSCGTPASIGSTRPYDVPRSDRHSDKLRLSPVVLVAGFKDSRRRALAVQ